MNLREHAIQGAIRSFENGIYKSLRKDVFAFGVPRSITQSWMLGY